MSLRPALLAVVTAVVLAAVAPVATAAAETTQSTATSAVSIDDATYEDAPQLAVSGVLEIVEAESLPEAEGEAHVHEDEHSTYLVTDSGERIELTGSLPDEAVSGARFDGTIALTPQASEQLDATPEVVADASDEPLDENDPANQELLATASTEQVAMPVASGTVRPSTASAVQAPSTHRLYVAVVGAKGSKSTATSFTNAKVSALVSKVSKYWAAQSGGVVEAITVADSTRYTSATACTASSVQTWWQEAGKKFTDDPNAFFSGSTGNHLVVLLPDGSSATGPCARTLGFTGLATVGQSSANGGYVFSIVGSSLDGATLAHEFGHNLSLRHANVATCASTKVTEGTSSPCGVDSYLDLYDVMGATVVGQSTIPSLSLPSKQRLGFVTSEDVTTVSLASGEADSSVTTVLSPIAASTGGRGLSVVDPISGDTYWIEYRSVAGQDKGLRANKSSFTMKSSVGSGYSYSYGAGVRILKTNPDRKTAPETLVLAVPSTSSSKNRSLALEGSEGFSSVTGGVHIDVVRTSSSAATVTIRLTSSATLVASKSNMTLGGTVGKGKTIKAPSQFFRQVSATRTYQWLRNGSPIAGATKSSYKATSADVGKKLSVTVTGALDGFTGATATSYSVTVPKKGTFSAASKKPKN
jgi:hypothetical protein